MTNRRKKQQPDFRKRQMAALLAVFVIVGASTAAVQKFTRESPEKMAGSESEASQSTSLAPSDPASPSPSASPTQADPELSPDPVFTYTDNFVPPQLVAGLLTCANRKSGALRQIRDVDTTCTPDEFNLGKASIDPGAKRPDALDAGLLDRFKAVQAAAKISANLDLEITSSWRSLEYQQQLFDRSISKNGSREEAMKWVALPEVSMHPWGLAIDINYYPGGREEANWVEKHGYHFGLCRAYENEWWHFEPLVAPGEKCPKMRRDANVGYSSPTSSPTP